MKKINRILLFAGVLFAAVGCDKDQLNTTFSSEGEDAQSAYFAQKTVSESFDASTTGEQIINVDIYRQSAGDEISVGLDYKIAEGGEDLFSVPESVTFAAGEYHAVVPVTVLGVENFAKGVNYSLTLYVGDHHDFVDHEVSEALDYHKQGLPVKNQLKTRAVSIASKYSSVTVTTTLVLNWQPAYILKDPTKLLSTDLTDADYVVGPDGKPMKQTGTYTYVFWWSGDDKGLTLERAEGTSVFRICDWGGGINLIFTVNPNKKVTVDGQEYYACSISEQYIGSDHSSYGEVYVADMLNYFGDDSAFEAYPCYWDGERTFIFNLMYYVGAGRFGYPSPEPFVLDSGVVTVEEPEPAVKIVYDGLSVSAMGIKTHTLSFTPNADAAKYYATVIKVDPELAEAADIVAQTVADKATREYLAEQGITEDHKMFEVYYSAYVDSFYDENYSDCFEGVAGEYAESLAPVAEEIVAGTYEGNFPVYELTKASSEAWDLGTTGGTFTAVAFSFDKTGEVMGTDFTTFVYNPDADSEQIDYDGYFGAYPNPAKGLFTYNSIYCFLQSPSLGDITSVQYVLLTAEEFDAAGLADDEQKQADYLKEKGHSLSAADLKDVNNVNPVSGGFETWLAAEPATAYKLLLAVSNADATSIAVLEHTTDAAVEPEKLAIETDLGESAAQGVYKHTHIIALFEASEVVEGAYLLATPKSLANYLTFDAEGVPSLNKDIKDKDVIELIQKNGTAFTSGNTSSNLASLNSKGAFQQPLRCGKPNTEFVVLAMAEYGNGEKSWAAKVQKTACAPAVAFEQTVEAEGKNINFNWTGSGSASIFTISKVVYALVPQSALTAAGVDMSKLGDEALNDFDARIAAGADKAAVAADAANAEKVLDVLGEFGKTFQNDAAKAINGKGGVNKQFPNVEAGEYALIALAYDTYNTKLTVGLVSVQ